MEILSQTDTLPPKFYPLKDSKVQPHSTGVGTDSSEPIPLVEVHPTADSGTSPAPNQSSTLSAGHEWKTNIHFVTLCFCLFLVGWNDGTVGPLLPKIQDVYHIGYTLVSVIFISNAMGFVVASIANVYLTDKLGFGVVMVIASTVQMIGYTLNSVAPSFPVFAFAYFLGGLGIAIQDAGSSGYVSSLKSSSRMGLLQALYGLGAFAAPLVSTQFAQITHWSYHYLVSLGLSVVNTMLLILVFRFKRQEDCLLEIGRSPAPPPMTSVQENKYKQIFRLKEVHLLALFLLLNVGVTSTLGGWIVTYINIVRGGGSNSGYISSGLYGGLTLGRVLLLWVNKKVGERRVVFCYIILAIVLVLVVWLVPSFIGNAVAIGFIGLLWGPVYPLVMNHASHILPPWILTGCITWIVGFGQAGSAFIPFLTGVIALKGGVASLQPFVVSLMGFMIIVWMVIPSTSRRVD
ncbi:hypothetical protein QCA50_020405 [Cerrena zonata]|uniref:Major facilitator superfamily (MFS) profile domain-containing protein n=1 Tax=Cerrena zonata TaxID=2478898 RepID=A0AAW0F995_9APHY